MALADDEHVAEPARALPRALGFLAGVLGGGRLPGRPAGRRLLPVGSGPGRWPDAWALAEDLARVAGLLVSPGDLYGEGGAGHVRIAVVQPMERLRLVAERLAAAGWV